MKEKKKKKWLKPRHKIVRNIAAAILKPYTRIKYGVSVERFLGQGSRQYLILYNHQTAFDQFFVGMAFRGAVYYVASEDIFSKGWISSLLRYLVAPIPIKKQATDVRAVMDCIRVAREGGTIAIAPEGNRTFSGKTGYINPAIAPLARKLGMPIAFLRIEGGYGVHPRWSDEVRRGKMRAYVSRVVEPSEYSGLTDAELTELIKGELSVNEGVADAVFRARRPAEHLERAFYVCPVCQGLSRFRTEGELISCLACGTTVRYTERKELLGVGCDFPFRFTTEWYDYQCDFMNKFDTGAHVDTPIYTETASFSEVIPYKRKRILAREAGISLFGDRITVSIRGEDILTYPFDEVSAVSVLGKNKVNIYIGKRIYQIKGDKSLNALKYVNVYYRYKNLRKGDSNEQFLGL